MIIEIACILQHYLTTLYRACILQHYLHTLKPIVCHVVTWSTGQHDGCRVQVITVVCLASGDTRFSVPIAGTPGSHGL